MAAISYPIYIFFGLAPSIIWLLFFLRKDVHPESNRTIIKIFIWGMLATLPTALLELGLYDRLKLLNFSPLFSQVLYIFLGIALVEETAKYLVVKKGIMKNPELDEPIDVILYMMIAALGFAAAENLFVLFPLSNPLLLWETLAVSLLRFVGATFLHALSSGALGYFLVLAAYKPGKQWRFLIQGLFTAVVLHGLYNLSIMKVEGSFKFIIPILVLAGLTAFVSLGFQKVKKIKSICSIT